MDFLQTHQVLIYFLYYVVFLFEHLQVALFRQLEGLSCWLVQLLLHVENSQIVVDVAQQDLVVEVEFFLGSEDVNGLQVKVLGHFPGFLLLVDDGQIVENGAEEGVSLTGVDFNGADNVESVEIQLAALVVPLGFHVGNSQIFENVDQLYFLVKVCQELLF